MGLNPGEGSLLLQFLCKTLQEGLMSGTHGSCLFSFTLIFSNLWPFTIYKCPGKRMFWWHYQVVMNLTLTKCMGGFFKSSSGETKMELDKTNDASRSQRREGLLRTHHLLSPAHSQIKSNGSLRKSDKNLSSPSKRNSEFSRLIKFSAIHHHEWRIWPLMDAAPGTSEHGLTCMSFTKRRYIHGDLTVYPWGCAATKVWRTVF